MDNDPPKQNGILFQLPALKKICLDNLPPEALPLLNQSSGTAAPQLPMNEDDPSRPLEHSDVRHDANWNLEFVRNGQDQNQNQG
ncbi:hypothetical protein L596_002499 [Steinernema carpocapsae]|uniref:Uncharacterized protein n=1 Tax=Steinernema carpocapsae TaxID=34508 RepID=A0A4U8UPS6_STECR|nr:hypothetical protein L596_002499 [Steinernema carpocapsae]